MPYDPYTILEVPRDADSVTIRRAYQRLARRFHPELCPGDSAAGKRFRQVARAYAVLSDPALRRRFEEGRLDLPAVSPRGNPLATGEEPPVRFRYQRFLAIHAEWAGEEPPSAQSGDDVAAEIVLDLGESIRGVTTSFSVQRERACGSCDGSGRVAAESCERCSGQGRVVDLDRLRVRIPPGVDDGTRLRLREKGSPSRDGDGAGDLLLTVRLRPHPYFRRQGLDVYAEVPVTFVEAALGAEIDIPTIDGPIRVHLPAGSSGGRLFRLRERGVALPDGRKGDHFYRLRIVVPETLDEEARDLLARLPRQDPRRDLPQEAL